MDISLIHSIWTVVALTLFILIGLWAFSGRNRKRFDAAARIPLEDGGSAARDSKQETHNG